MWQCQYVSAHTLRGFSSGDTTTVANSPRSLCGCHREREREIKLNRIPNAMKFIHYEGLSGPKKVNDNNNRVAISVVSLPGNDNVSVCNRIHALYKYINLTTARHITFGVMNSLFS